MDSQVKQLKEKLLNAKKEEIPGIRDAIKEKVASKKNELSELEDLLYICNNIQYYNKVKCKSRNGKCFYKSPTINGGGWCNNSLTSEKELSTGYCSHHIEELNL